MLSILNQLKAEELLKGQDILPKIDKLKESFIYKTDDEKTSFEDFYNLLIKQADQIEQIQLQTIVPPGTAQKYLVDLTQALQLVLDKVEGVHTKALYFLGKLNSALHNRNNLLVTFTVWYQIALTQSEEINLKLTAATVKALAESEFTRLLGEDNDMLEGMKGAVEVLIDRLKLAKKLAMEKYKIGTEQANASIIKMPNQSYTEIGAEPFGLLKSKYGMTAEIPAKSSFDDEDEDITTDSQLPLAPENPEYVEHREVPSPDKKIFKSLEAVVKHPDLGETADLEHAKELWRQDFAPERDEEVGAKLLEDSDSASVPDESIDIEDPFLGTIKLVKDEEGETKVKKSTTAVFDDEEETPIITPKKFRPKYDDEEDEEPIVEPKPQEPSKQKRERKKISFDMPF